MKPQGVSNILIGLYKMGVDWNDLNPSYRQSLVKGLLRVINHQSN